MSAMIQTTIVIVAVLVAAAYAGRKVWRTLRPRKSSAGCDSGCGCDTGATTGDDWAKS